ncbi:Gldg family protein [bacterium]|nr:Gldg family protein [bacterium]
MSKVVRIAQKELSSYFSSPVAFLFLGGFLTINLFLFFWVSQFFARNIADVRPLFQWMPLLLIFLVSALTMKMWSEERRAGTVEFLMTLPVSTAQLVFGKMCACLALVIIALALTLPLPITVAQMGLLDWGPVLGGYVASICLAAAYISIGLFVSARNENQIVSLMTTVILCLVLYLLGSSLLVPLFGNDLVGTLQLLGSGSRFESITRGVLDLRDLFYYLSITGIFLSLNIYALERLRWEKSRTGGESQGTSKQNSATLWKTLTALCVANFLIANFWLHDINSARVDLTKNQMYSISGASKNYLEQLREPLLIRGYFSEKTHPLLAPLVPQIRDLLREYEVVSDGRVRAEFVDPRENPELEQEANQKYGIKPVPFQISNKYDVSLVNSYFDLLVLYGDKYEVINFQELIDVKVSGDSEIDVRLRNPEYDITRSIKKVVYGFQTTEALFDSLPKPVEFLGYISDKERLPENLQQYLTALNESLNELSILADGKFQIQMTAPEEGGEALQVQLRDQYGITPVRTLFSPEPFYFSPLLRLEDRIVPVSIPEELTPEAAKRSVEAALKRLSPGFLKTIGVIAPAVDPMSQFNPQAAQGNKNFSVLQAKLQEDYQVETVDAKNGVIENEIDLLFVLAPKQLEEKELFAIDQFLMKGGSVLLATSPFEVTRTQTALQVENRESGLEEWLKEKGLSFESELVLDPQNESYPIPVQREIAGFRVQEIQKVPYPLFVDVRADGMNEDTLITSGITQMTMNWASPIVLDDEKTQEFSLTELLKSSEQSWTAELTSVVPDFERYGPSGFPSPKKPRAPHTLAVVVEGSFSSLYTGEESPLLVREEEEGGEGEEEPEQDDTISTVIEKSPESARLILFASNEFLTDQTLQISASGGTSRYLNSLQLLQNAADWALEDRGLLSIRGRGHFSRTLYPLERAQQLTWEYGNYVAALLLLLLVFIASGIINQRRTASHRSLVESFSA